MINKYGRRFEIRLIVRLCDREVDTDDERTIIDLEGYIEEHLGLDGIVDIEHNEMRAIQGLNSFDIKEIEEEFYKLEIKSSDEYSERVKKIICNRMNVSMGEAIVILESIRDEWRSDD